LDEVVAVAVRPDDIALSSEPLPAISIQNQFMGTVINVIKHHRSALVEIDVGQPLWSQVSFKAVDDLSITPGKKICCLIKAHALHYVNC
jgi:molybdopterin-binding protein